MLRRTRGRNVKINGENCPVETSESSCFFNKIKACHLNNHSPRNEINVVRTLRDIEVQSCPFGMVERYNIRKEWDLICGVDDN